MASLIPILPLVFILFTTFYHLGEAHTFTVGGKSHGWKVPEANNTLSHWAESSRFRVGDFLEFHYDSKKDSVLQVTEQNYNNCITDKPMKEYKEDVTSVKLNASGPHYFISGASGNCPKGEKVEILVQSPNHHPPMPPTPSSKPPTSPATPATPSSKSPTSPSAPAPGPDKNTAVGLVAASGIFWAFVAVIGLAWA